MTPWTVACQAPLSMESSKQEYWNGFPFLIPGDLPDPGIEHVSLAFAGRFFTTSVTMPAWQKSIIPRWQGFDPWVRKIPWRRKCQPTPVFLPGASHGQRTWQVAIHKVTKSRTWLKWHRVAWQDETECSLNTHLTSMPTWRLPLTKSMSTSSTVGLAH